MPKKHQNIVLLYFIFVLVKFNHIVNLVGFVGVDTVFLWL